MYLTKKFDWRKMIDVGLPRVRITEETKKLSKYGHGEARDAINELKESRKELGFFRRILGYYKPK